MPLRAEAVLKLLVRYRGKNRYCWPRQETLAAELGICRRQLQHWITYLGESGMIEIERTNRSNRYWIPPRNQDTSDAVSDAQFSAPSDAQFSSSPDAQKSAPSDAQFSAHQRKTTLDELGFSSSNQQGAAAAAVQVSEEEKTLQALVELEMPESVRSIAEGDESLAKAALLHFQFRFKTNAMDPIRNRRGYIVGVLRDPERAGFTRDDRGNWRPPANEPPLRTSQGREHPKVEEHLANMRAFDALPRDTLARIRAFVRQRAPLFASKSDGNDAFRMECIAVMAQWRREGKL